MKKKSKRQIVKEIAKKEKLELKAKKFAERIKLIQQSKSRIGSAA
jgi:hypothetical protein